MGNLSRNVEKVVTATIVHSLFDGLALRARNFLHRVWCCCLQQACAWYFVAFSVCSSPVAS